MWSPSLTLRFVSVYPGWCAAWQPANWLLSRSPGLEQQQSESERWFRTVSRQQTPSRTSEGKSSKAEQAIHREYKGRTGPLGSLPLHVSASLFDFFSLRLELLAATEGHSQILCCLSLKSHLLTQLSLWSLLLFGHLFICSTFSNLLSFVMNASVWLAE